MNDKKKKKKKKQSFHTTQDSHTLQGTLEITRSGIGYVVIAGGKGDVLVRPHDFNTALNGDEVTVKVIKENTTTGKKEGRIVNVIERKQTEFIGRLQVSQRFAFVKPDSDKPMPDIYVSLDNITGAVDRDKVSVQLIKWEKGSRKPEGKVTAIGLTPRLVFLAGTVVATMVAVLLR